MVATFSVKKSKEIPEKPFLIIDLKSIIKSLT